MDVQKNGNCIFFIKNDLEDFTDFFKYECSNFYYKSLQLEELDGLIEKFKVTSTKENLLLILNKELFNIEIKEKIKKIFSTHLDIYNPHLLFVSENECSVDEQNEIIAKQNFFFKIPKSIEKGQEKSSLYFFLILIFQHMKDLNRLNDYIINSFQTIVTSELINKQKIEIQQLYDELEELSKIDVLTNVLNRKAFFEEMEREKTRTIREIWRLEAIKDKRNFIKNPQKYLQTEEIKKIIDENPKSDFLEHYGRLTCMMIDIDDFKKINDTYGHLMGDQVLREIGDLLKSGKIFRDNDIIGRYGGEEFIVILPETNVKHSKIPAERLRKFINEKLFQETDVDFNVTVSIGISELNINDDKCEDLINRADKALYYAKENGKNMTVIYDVSHSFKKIRG